MTLWGKQAEAAAQYLQKGRVVYVEGRLRVEEYTGKEGGPRYSLEVNATDLQFIGGGRDAGETLGARRAAAAVSQGRPPSQPGDWVIKDGRPVRIAPPEIGVAADSGDADRPF